MKFIKNHLMFILPLMAILLGVEFYLVFDRTTNSYEKGLKDGYSMLVVSYEPISIDRLKELNNHVSSSKEIKRKNIVKEIAKGVSKNAYTEILGALPHFYSVHLDAYLGTSKLEQIKKDLESAAKEALKPLDVLTERLKIKTSENVPKGFIKKAIYKIRKKTGL